MRASVCRYSTLCMTKFTAHLFVRYGMLRALGLRHRSLIQMLIMQALSFSLPGIAIGLGLAFLLFWPVSKILSDQSSTTVRAVLTSDALILGTPRSHRSLQLLFFFCREKLEIS